jgi:hypothetical protein
LSLPPGTTAVVRVEITDVNDNRPYFANTTHRVALPRTQTGRVDLVLLDGRDADSGDNGEVHYVMVAESLPGLFSINELTGMVTLERPLCGPQVANRTDLLFVAAAHDNGVPQLDSLSNGSAHVYIDILDNNTNAPQFNSTEYVQAPFIYFFTLGTYLLLVPFRIRVYIEHMLLHFFFWHFFFGTFFFACTTRIRV